ncbi:MAG: ribosome biogenesis GTP-binding protein YihA/YsxC [Alphaproteobacteria bacterium]
MPELEGIEEILAAEAANTADSLRAEKDAEKEHKAWLGAGEDLFRQPCDFVMGVVSFDKLPVADRLEVAFAGRSNVGKSSLINALTRRRNLARSSNTPGRTRELNFFNLADCTWIVDLPGYGYAKAPKTEIARWTGLTRDYLLGRQSLRRIYLLIDARHGLKPNDMELIGELDRCAVSYQIILTKGDKLKKTELEKVRVDTLNMLKTHPAAHPSVIGTSSEKEWGIPELRAEIANFLTE